MKTLPLLFVPVAVGVLLAVAPPAAQPRPWEPIDPQQVQDQETMTWKDYRPIPGTKWDDNAVPRSSMPA